MSERQSRGGRGGGRARKNMRRRTHSSLALVIVSWRARQLYVFLALLPLLHLQIALSINPVSWLLLYLFIYYLFYSFLCLQMLSFEYARVAVLGREGPNLHAFQAKQTTLGNKEIHLQTCHLCLSCTLIRVLKIS